MSKAILILNEMPSKCGDCPLLQQWYDDEYKKRFDMCFWRYCKIEDTESKLNICPLKPMPSKKESKEIKHFNDFVYVKTEYDLITNDIVGKIKYDVETIFTEGYNSCLDEILGGETE